MTTDTKKLAASLVAQQIKQYNAEIASLGEQIKHLEALREARTMMCKALLPLAGKASPNPAPSSPVITPKTAAVNMNGATPVAKAGGTGFASAVRDALRDQPKGATPSDVAEQMKTRGTAALYTGKTPFGTRVGNELHRLMRAGEISRRSGRYYFIQQELHQ